MALVLVLGATSAIAAEMCKRFASRGDRLFLVGRSASKLDVLREAIGDAVVGYEIADLDELGHNEARVQSAIAALGGLDIAVIAHGALGDQAQTEASFAAAEAILRTNFLSAVSLIVPIANELERQGHGSLLVLSSVAGVRGRPRNYTYGSAKSALTTYLQGVRSRLWKRGVHVHTIKLGPVHSPMTVDHPKNALFARPETVAPQILARLDRPGNDWFVPTYWALIMAVVRRLPEPVFQRVSALAER